MKTAEFHTIVTRHLEWFKRKNMRQTIGRPAPVPNPMTFLFEPLLVKIYTQICARLHRDSAAPFGIRSLHELPLFKFHHATSSSATADGQSQPWSTRCTPSQARRVSPLRCRPTPVSERPRTAAAGGRWDVIDRMLSGPSAPARQPQCVALCLRGTLTPPLYGCVEGAATCSSTLAARTCGRRAARTCPPTRSMPLARRLQHPGPARTQIHVSGVDGCMAAKWAAPATVHV